MKVWQLIWPKQTSLFYRTLLKSLMCVSLCLAASNTYADSSSVVAASSPHSVVSDTTERVLSLLQTGVDPVTQPDEFVSQLSLILDPVVAFQYIAKGVMGIHAKQASEEQVAQFAEAFKRGLVSTYGRGISGFQGLEITVLPPIEPVGNERRATVVQEIRSSGGVTKVSYSMAKNRQGQWKMINLVLNGINFGQTFRGQFAAAVEKNNGDVAKTIADWEKGVGI